MKSYKSRDFSFGIIRLHGSPIAGLESNKLFTIDRKRTNEAADDGHTSFKSSPPVNAFGHVAVGNIAVTLSCVEANFKLIIVESNRWFLFVCLHAS